MGLRKRELLNQHNNSLSFSLSVAVTFSLAYYCLARYNIKAKACNKKKHSHTLTHINTSSFTIRPYRRAEFSLVVNRAAFSHRFRLLPLWFPFTLSPFSPPPLGCALGGYGSESTRFSALEQTHDCVAADPLVC